MDLEEGKTDDEKNDMAKAEARDRRLSRSAAEFGGSFALQETVETITRLVYILIFFVLTSISVILILFPNHELLKYPIYVVFISALVALLIIGCLILASFSKNPTSALLISIFNISLISCLFGTGLSFAIEYLLQSRS